MGLLARTYKFTGQTGKAEEIYHKCLQLDPKNISIKGSLAWTYLKFNRLEDAEQQYLEIMEIDTSTANFNRSVGHHRLALLYAKMGRFEEAEQQLQIVLSKENVGHHEQLIAAAIYSFQNEVDKAYEYFEQAFENGFKYEKREIYVVDIDKDFVNLRAHTERWAALVTTACRRHSLPSSAPCCDWPQATETAR